MRMHHSTAYLDEFINIFKNIACPQHIMQYKSLKIVVNTLTATVEMYEREGAVTPSLTLKIPIKQTYANIE